MSRVLIIYIRGAGKNSARPERFPGNKLKSQEMETRNPKMNIVGTHGTNRSMLNLGGPEVSIPPKRLHQTLLISVEGNYDSYSKGSLVHEIERNYSAQFKLYSSLIISD